MGDTASISGEALVRRICPCSESTAGAGRGGARAARAVLASRSSRCNASGRCLCRRSTPLTMRRRPPPQTNFVIIGDGEGGKEGAPGDASTAAIRTAARVPLFGAARCHGGRRAARFSPPTSVASTSWVSPARRAPTLSPLVGSNGARCCRCCS